MLRAPARRQKAKRASPIWTELSKTPSQPIAVSSQPALAWTSSCLTTATAPPADPQSRPAKAGISITSPPALGGWDTTNNMQILCRLCHGTKTTKRDAPTIAKVERIRWKFWIYKNRERLCKNRFINNKKSTTIIVNIAKQESTNRMTHKASVQES